MKTRVVLRRAAELDLEAIGDWYEAEAAGFGAEFRNAIDELFERISDNPMAYPERYRGNRRAFLRRFPYVVWYRLQDGLAVVVACVHGSRDPRVARARIRGGA